jgi:hypothetical protein
MATLKKTKKDVITFSLENGMELTGTVEQIKQACRKMGVKANFKGYYPSASKGMVKISEMNDYHLRRALIKTAKDYFTGMYKAEDSNKTFLEKFIGLAENELVQDLFNELKRR